MEIESVFYNLLYFTRTKETKGVSWKWRLKDFIFQLRRSNFDVETKGVSWKWRLKVVMRRCVYYQIFTETKGVSWKWRLKVPAVVAPCLSHGWKQRESPENGDWKAVSFSTTARMALFRNKGSLLKMEIERALRWGRQGSACRETKGVSWKWRLKDHSIRHVKSLQRNKGSLLKMEIESQHQTSPCTTTSV